MDKYVCNICGYVYDPEAGDPDNGVNPGTAFEDLPDDWVCPVCGYTVLDLEVLDSLFAFDPDTQEPVRQAPVFRLSLAQAVPRR